MAKIMIIAGDQEQAEMLVHFLQQDGHNVLQVPNADLAFRPICEQRPDLLLLDITHPDEKAAGFDLARNLHLDLKLRAMPIMMLTTPDDYPFNFSAQDLNSEWFPVSALLEKPLDINLVRQKIAGLIRG